DAAAASNAAPGTGGAGEDAIPTTGSEGSEDLRVINSAAPAKAPGATARASIPLPVRKPRH
ncbi:MAG TPA: hypothetical protein VNR88_04845, partial [Hyphomicrobium sp.]|nr:hypothetical protein [Hyphomicrobium sp.]